MAAFAIGGDLTGLTHHSDHGSNGLHKTRLIRRRGPWRTIEQVEYPTLEWVWWWNNQRLNGELGMRTPLEAEAAYCADLESPRLATAGHGKSWERNPGRFKPAHDSAASGSPH